MGGDMRSGTPATLRVMSRGHGPLQDFILDGVNQHPDQAYPAAVVADLWCKEQGVPSTLHARASARRAIGRLEAEGLVSTWDYLLPTAILASGKPAGERWTMCVARRHADFDDERFYLAAREWMLKMLLAEAKAELEEATR